MQRAIDFITTQLNLPLDYVTEKVEEYVMLNDKQDLDSSDVKVIINNIVNQVKPTIGGENDTIRGALDFNLDDIDEDFEVDLDEIESTKEKNSTENLIYAVIILFVTSIFAIPILSDVIRIPVALLFLYILLTIVSIVMAKVMLFRNYN